MYVIPTYQRQPSPAPLFFSPSLFRHHDAIITTIFRLSIRQKYDSWNRGCLSCVKYIYFVAYVTSRCNTTAVVATKNLCLFFHRSYGASRGCTLICRVWASLSLSTHITLRISIIVTGGTVHLRQFLDMGLKTSSSSTAIKNEKYRS